RRDAPVLGREDLRVISFAARLGLVRLLLSEPEEALHVGLAVGAALPLAGRTPGECGRAGRALERLARVEQRLHVDSVVCQCHCHGDSLPKITRRSGADPATGAAGRERPGSYNAAIKGGEQPEGAAMMARMATPAARTAGSAG